MIHDLLTYLLTPWSRVLLEKLTGSAASQEIPRIFGTRRFITVLTSSRHLSLSWANSIQSPQPPPPSHFLKIHLNVILPSASGPPQWSLSLRSPHQKPVHPSPLPHTLHMPRPSHSSRFYHRNSLPPPILVEALCYKSEGRGFYIRWCHRNFSLT